MPNTRRNSNCEFLSLSTLKPKRKLAHEDSIRLAKKQNRCPLRKKKVQVDVNNCSFTSDDDDIPEVTSAHYDYDVAQAHKNFIQELSNAMLLLSMLMVNKLMHMGALTQVLICLWRWRRRVEMFPSFI